jgi:hypothetical protein
MHPLFIVLLLMVTQVGPTVTVSTDRGFYSPGDQVVIRVSATGFDENDTLWLYVDKPDGRNLYFGELPANGDTVVVRLPQDAPDGTYTVTVTWDHRYIETGFIVETQPIPEFPFPLVVLFVAFTIAALTLARRKASARTSAPANDSGARRIH